MRRVRLFAILLLLAAFARPAGASSAAPRAVVNVSVATVWTSPSSLRPVDAPSATNPVNIPLWLSRLSIADQQGLIGRVQTQALHGTTVTILARQGTWSKVAVQGQPTQLHRLGYPGWMPTRQLTRNLSFPSLQASHPVAIVTSKLAWLRNPTTNARTMQVTFSTWLPVLGSSGSSDLVATASGGRARIARSDVAVYPSIRAVPKPSGSRLVAVARRFLGLYYQWGGTSAYAFDCSGFMWTIFHRFGITLPRDADRQALHGAPVARSQLRPGDLLFFAGTGGVGHVHHVSMYVGNGLMIDAPDIGKRIRIVPLSVLAYEYAGARRYL